MEITVDKKRGKRELFKCEIADWCGDNHLRITEIGDYHWRLGNKLDVFIQTKPTKRAFVLGTKKWINYYELDELKKYIKN
jgi:hypothetical protein